MKKFGFSVLLALLLGFVSFLSPLGRGAQASTVDVSYTISGSSGNWLYDFTVTNNIPNTNPGYDFVYYFGAGVSPSGTTGITSPAGWSPIPFPGYAAYGNLSTPTNLAPGQTVTGFDFIDTSLAAQTSLSWIAGVGTSSFTSYQVAGNVSATPLPPAWTMMLVGIVGFGFFAFRRNSKPALMAA
jgi:hypothetical protein